MEPFKNSDLPEVSGQAFSPAEMLEVLVSVNALELVDKGDTLKIVSMRSPGKQKSP
jgi:hypothetical protein